jgi:hypothetical protein
MEQKRATPRREKSVQFVLDLFANVPLAAPIAVRVLA